MADYNSSFTGEEIDEAVGKVLSPDTTPTAGSTKPVTSEGIKNYVDSGLADKQAKIAASGVLIGDGSGGVTAKTLDTSSLTNDNDHVATSGVIRSALTTLDNAKIGNGGYTQVRGMYSTSASPSNDLNRIKYFIDTVLSTNNTTTQFNVVLNQTGRHMFAGFVYPDKNYGQGILIKTDGTSFLWSRIEGTDALEEVAPKSALDNLIKSLDNSVTVNTGVVSSSKVRQHGDVVIVTGRCTGNADATLISGLPSANYAQIGINCYVLGTTLYLSQTIDNSAFSITYII